MLKMSQNSSGLFIYLMNLAWKCRISLPALLTCSIALLGQACVLHINISTQTVSNANLGLAEDLESLGSSSESDGFESDSDSSD